MSLLEHIEKYLKETNYSSLEIAADDVDTSLYWALKSQSDTIEAFFNMEEIIRWIEETKVLYEKLKTLIEEDNREDALEVVYELQEYKQVLRKRGIFLEKLGKELKRVV